MYQSNEFPFQLSPWDAPTELDGFLLEGDRMTGTQLVFTPAAVAVPYSIGTTVIDWTNGHAPVRFRRLLLLVNAFTGSPTLYLTAWVNWEIKIYAVEWINDVEGLASLNPFDVFVPGGGRLQVSLLNLSDDLAARTIRLVLVGPQLDRNAKGGP